MRIGEFWLHDYLHDEGLGPFRTREEAIAEAVRVAAIPWNEPPNLAPCVDWETCGRDYAVVEVDASTDPPLDMDAPLVVRIDRNGARWMIDPSGDIRRR
jgi:hypothetical protein